MAKIEFLNLYRQSVVDWSRVPVSQAEFITLLDVAEKYIEELRLYRKDQKGLDKALSVIKEMKFVAFFNHKFRQENFHKVKELVDDMYTEIHTPR
jgi:hypothetical protein